MHYERLKNPGKPVLVCVPGMLGGPENFQAMIPELQVHYEIIFVDPNQERRKKGLSKLTQAETELVSFHSSAEEIKEVLAQYQIEKAYFFGLSLGGKIVYDFAIRYPDSFLGAVITDVAPSSFLDSSLYQMVSQIVDGTDLNLPWEELKKSFLTLIPERNLRSLIQSQVSYPNQTPPGIWKTAMKGLGTLLRQNSIDDQTEAFDRANHALLERKLKIALLCASQLSGITEAGLAKIKSDWASITVTRIENSTHFIHVTHQDLALKLVLQMLEGVGRTGPGTLKS